MTISDYYYKIGLSLYNSGRYAEALVYFNNAEKEEKDELKLAIIFYYKGLSFNIQGRKYDKNQFSNAIEYFNKAIEILKKNKNEKLYQDHEFNADTIIGLAEYNLGYIYGEQLYYESAIEHYSRAEKHFVTDKKLTLELADVYPDIGYGYAQFDFIINKKLTLELADVYRGLGNACAQLEKIGEAMEYFNKAIEIQPDFAYVYNTKGYVLNLQEKYDDAIECFEKSLEKDPSFDRALRNKGYALNSLGRYNNNIEESIEKYKKAMDCLNEAISIEPRDAFSWYYKGYSHIYLKNYDDAIECFDKALEIQPDFAYVYNTKGVILYHLKKLDDAIECFEKSIMLSKEKLNQLPFELRKIDWEKQLGDAYNNKGYTLIKKNTSADTGSKENLDNIKYCFDKAIECFDKAIKGKPNEKKKAHLESLLGDAYDNKGHILNHLNSYNDAIECFEKSIGYFDNAIKYYKNQIEDGENNIEHNYQLDHDIIKRDLADTYRDKGFAFSKLDKKEDATKNFEKATEKDPKFPYAWNSLGYHYINSKYSEDKAIECFDKAIDLSKNEANQCSDNEYLAYSYYNKGYAYYLKGRKDHDGIRYEYYESNNDFDKSIECFDKAIERKPDYHLLFYILYTKGITLIELKRYNDAIECFEKSIMLSKEKLNQLPFELRKIDWEKQLGDAYNNKGYVLNILGRYTEAIECFDNVVRFTGMKQNSFSIINKGVALFSLKKYTEAIECLNKDSNLFVDHNDLFYLIRGASNYMLERYLDAKRDFSNVGEKYIEKYIEKYNGIGLCCEKLGLFEEMKNAYEKVISSNSRPESKVIANYNLGVFYNDKDDLEESKKKFEECLINDPNFIKAREALSKLKSKRNNNFFSWWFQGSQTSKNLFDNKDKIKWYNKLMARWEKDIQRKVGIGLTISISFFILFIGITAFLNLLNIVLPMVLGEINKMSEVVLATTVILLGIFLLPLPISKKINFGGMQLEIEKPNEITDLKIASFIQIEPKIPSDFINYPLESYNAPLQHPIHMPSLFAMSHELYYYESRVRIFFEK